MYGATYEIIPTPDSAAKYGVAHSPTLYALDTLAGREFRFPTRRAQIRSSVVCWQDWFSTPADS